MSVLELKNVSKVIGKRKIVKGINMSVQPGEVYGFLGPNGAGKTTTIRMIVGLIKATSGTITICGHDITKDHDKAMQKVGCIVENPETYSYLSGYKNLVHYARLAGISNMEKRIREVVELVNLKDRIHDKVKRYSLGMRQRLGLAQALLNKPKLLILDEPTNGLDPAGIREFRDLMRQLANSGMAVFVSSHLLGEVQQLCDRVAILKDGVIVTEKDVKHLLETGSSTYHICVDQEQLALHLLNREQIPVQVVKSNMIQVEVNEEQIKWIVRFLVENNVNISLVEKSSDSLEELFLNLTEESGRSEMMKEKVKYYA